MNQTFVYIQYIHVLGCGTCPWTEILRLFDIFFCDRTSSKFFFAVLSPSNSLSFIILASTSEQWLKYWFPARLPQCRKHNENSCVKKKHIRKQKQTTLTQNYIRPVKSKTSFLMMVVSLTRCLRTCLKFWAQLLVKPFHPWFSWTYPWFWGLLLAPCWGTSLIVTCHPIGDHHTILNFVVLHVTKKRRRTSCNNDPYIMSFFGGAEIVKGLRKLPILPLPNSLM